MHINFGRTLEGCQILRCKDLLRTAAGLEFNEKYLLCGLAPLRGAHDNDDVSGGLRGLRPPATFLQPFGLLRSWLKILF